MESDIYRIVCDGGKRNDIAYGSFKVFDSSDNSITHHSMVFGFGTANMAEYLALINAVKYCHANGIKSVDISSDSALMLNQIAGTWKTTNKNPLLKRLRDIARKELKNLDYYSLNKLHNSEVKKILGH